MTAPIPAAFVATHLVPAAGLSAWSDPDPTQTPVAQLDPDLEVRVVERRGDWARIKCSNSWEAWVDGRRLIETRATAPDPTTVSWRSASPTTGPARPAVSVDDVGIPALLGAALVIIGSFLKWWTVGSGSITAWHIPVKFLLAGNGGTGVDVGPFLLVVVLVLLPLLTRRPLPAWALPLVPVIPLAAGMCALLRGLRESPAVHPGIGLLLTIAGGAIILVQTRGLASIRLKRSAP